MARDPLTICIWEGDEDEDETKQQCGEKTIMCMAENSAVQYVQGIELCITGRLKVTILERYSLICATNY